MPTLTPYAGPDLFAMAGAAGAASGTARGTSGELPEIAGQYAHAAIGAMNKDWEEKQAVHKNQHFLDLVKQRHPEIEQDPDYGILEGIAQTGGDMAKGIEWFNTYKQRKTEKSAADEHKANMDELSRYKALGTIGPDGQFVPGSMQVGAEKARAGTTRANAYADNVDSMAGHRDTQDAQGAARVDQGWERINQGAQGQNNTEAWRASQRERWGTVDAEKARHDREMEAGQASRGPTEQDAQFAELKVQAEEVGHHRAAMKAFYDNESRKTADTGRSEKQIMVARRAYERSVADESAVYDQMRAAAGSAKRAHIPAAAMGAHPTVVAGTAKDRALSSFRERFGREPDPSNPDDVKAVRDAFQHFQTGTP